MPKVLNVLILEDNPADAELLLIELRRAGYEPASQIVDNQKDFSARLKPELDLILSDYNLPQFNGLQALQLRNESGYDIPFIIVSGEISEELAVECMREGADDYLFKDRLGRLGAAVDNTLREKRLRDEKQQARQDIELLLDLSRQAGAETSLDDLLFFIANRIVEVIPPAEAVSIFLYEEKRKIVKVRAWAGLYGNEVKGIEFKVERIQVGRIFRSKKPGLIKDVSRDPDFVPVNKPGIREIKSLIAVPLIIKKRVIGIINADNMTKADAFSQKNLDLVESIGNQLSGVIENARLLDQLQQSEEQYRSVVEDSPGIISRFLPDGTITFVNQEYCRFFEKEYDEVIGTNIKSTIPEEDRESVMASIASLSPESPIRSIEIKNIKHDGETRWMRWKDHALFDNKGQVINYQSFGEDITKSKQSEQALHLEQERAQKYLDIAEVMIVALDKDGMITLLNQKGASILGYKIEELMGKNWINTCVLESDQKQTKKKFDEFMSGGEGLGDHFEQTVITKSGEERIIDWHSTPLWEWEGEKKHRIGSLSSGEDSTERKLIGEALIKSEKLYKDAESLEHIGHWDLIYSDEKLAWSEEVFSIFGIENDALPSSLEALLKHVHPEDREIFREQIEKAEDFRSDYRIMMADGSIKYLHEEVLNERNEDGKIKITRGTVQDNTERRLAEDALRQYEHIVSSSTDMLALLDKQSIYLAANTAYVEAFNLTHEQLIGKSVTNVFGKKVYNTVIKPHADRCLGGEEVNYQDWFDFPAYGRRYMHITYYPYYGEDKKIVGFVVNGRNITERKRAEETIRQEKEKAQKYLDVAGVIIIALNKKGEITLINQKGNQILGYQEDELIGVNWFDTCVPERYKKERKQVLMKILAGEAELDLYRNDNLVLTRSGEERTIAWYNTVLKDEKGHSIGTLSSGEDITERVRAEQLLTALNRAAVSMGIAMTQQEIFNVVSEALKHLDISCFLLQPDETQDKVFIKYLSYESASIKIAEKLVGIKQEDFSVSIDAVDFIKEVVSEKKTFFADKTEQILQQMLPKISKKLLAQIVKTLHVQRSISVPLIVEDEVIGIFSIQSNNLTREDVPAATAFADQLSSAWNKIGLLQDLRKTVEGTIHTIAATVEARDPYTAGHQKRVADLAAAIAREMKLTDEQVEGIKMAGVIHDLGKVQIPAEILSKPGKISELEFEIIKTHSQVGFDLLKEIEFPWPIAQMVLQHHEMMDGSGYPQGLKGDEILLEARILAVADVVEAMASHRPYRPAHGIEKALKQIRQNKGTLLDPKVVGACLKVFKQGYKFPNE